MPRPWCLDKAPRPRCRGDRSRLCHRHPTHPVSVANITAAAALAPHYVRIQILAQRIFVVPAAGASAGSIGLPDSAVRILRQYLNVLEAVIQKHSAPDVDFVLNPLDTTPPWPAFNQHAGHHYQWSVGGEVDGLDPFLIPSHEDPWRVPSAPPISRKQWAAKRSIAAWRGSNTGFARTSLASWSGNMRARLTVLSRMYPDALDAAITGWPQPYGGNLSVLKRFLRAAPKTLPTYTSRYKYMVDVDGNVQSNRFRHVMTQGAIVLKATNFVSAYAASLHALPHVIMVKPDLSDLVSTVRCLQRHDAAALRALHRGTVVAADLLSYESVLGYWADLLHHYAALQTFTPQRLEGAVPASRLTSWLGRLVGAKPFGVVG